MLLRLRSILKKWMFFSEKKFLPCTLKWVSLTKWLEWLRLGGFLGMRLSEVPLKKPSLIFTKGWCVSEPVSLWVCLLGALHDGPSLDFSFVEKFLSLRWVNQGRAPTLGRILRNQSNQQLIRDRLRLRKLRKPMLCSFIFAVFASFAVNIQSLLIL